MQTNFSNTVATLKGATQQTPKCMQRFPFSSLGRRFETVLCTQELHTLAHEPRLVSVQWTAGLAAFSCLQSLLLLTSNQETYCRWWAAWRETTSWFVMLLW